MSWLEKNMDILLKQVALDYPKLSFKGGTNFYWSPSEKTVYYANNLADLNYWRWTLLHEISHGVLGHKTFRSDFELLQLELAAWMKAQELATKYNIEISKDHIEDCLDTYRDWLHKRSLCPGCSVKSLQKSPGVYACLNCSKEWQVSENRLCRPYRASLKV
jgi:hypothetical protein